MTLAESTALATWVQAVAVLLAVGVAIWQIWEVRRTRRDEAKAYVVAYLEFHDERYFLPDIVLENVGRTAAYDVHVSYVPDIRSTLYRDPEDVRAPFFTGGVPSLAPGQRLATLFDSMVDRPEEWEDVYELSISYKDVYGKAELVRAVLDLTVYKALHGVVRHGLHDVHAELKKLVQEVKHLRSGFGGPMPVRVRSGHALRHNQAAAHFRTRVRGPIPHMVVALHRYAMWWRHELNALRRWPVTKNQTWEELESELAE